MANGQTTVRVNRLLYGYADAIENWLARVERATDESTAGKYSPQSLLSDVVSSWADVARVWNLPYKVCEDRMRVVVFEITQATNEMTRTIPIPDPGPGALVVDDFVDAAGNKIIPQANVSAYTADSGRTLVVRLFGLQALPQKIPKGMYESPVHQAGQPQIALVRVIVS
jgi:hypothetical protein